MPNTMFELIQDGDGFVVQVRDSAGKLYNIRDARIENDGVVIDENSLKIRKDWQENSIDSPAYIQNRTHYEDAEGTVLKELDSKYITTALTPLNTQLTSLQGQINTLSSDKISTKNKLGWDVDNNLVLDGSKVINQSALNSAINGIDFNPYLKKEKLSWNTDANELTLSDEATMKFMVDPIDRDGKSYITTDDIASFLSVPKKFVNGVETPYLQWEYGELRAATNFVFDVGYKVYYGDPSNPVSSKSDLDLKLDKKNLEWSTGEQNLLLGVTTDLVLKGAYQGSKNTTNKLVTNSEMADYFDDKISTLNDYNDDIAALEARVAALEEQITLLLEEAEGQSV